MNPNKIAFTKNQIDAIHFATVWHDTQRRVDTVLPYIVHPIEVATFAGRFYPKNQDLILAAYLHDVLEDTPCSEDDIKGQFGETILNLVKGVTAKDEHFPTWKERRQHQIDKLRNSPLDVVRLKACDMLSNAKSIGFDRQYRPHDGYPKFRSDPRAVLWYYNEAYLAILETLPEDEVVVEALHDAVMDMSW